MWQAMEAVPRGPDSPRAVGAPEEKESSMECGLEADSPQRNLYSSSHVCLLRASHSTFLILSHD